MFPLKSLLFLLLWLAVADEEVGEVAEQCNSAPKSPETRRWCQQSCTQLLAFVRMRMPYDTMDFKVFSAANKMNTWAICPSAFRSIVFARLTHELKQLTSEELTPVERKVRVAEHAAREFVIANISGYLAAGTSFAPWFHLGTVFDVIKEKFPQVLERQEEFRLKSQARVLKVLRDHLDSDAPQVGPLEKLEGWRDLGGISTLDRAALLFAEADFLRVKEAYGIPGSGGIMGKARDEMNRLLNLAQRFLLQSYKHTRARAPAGKTELYGLFTMVYQSGLPLFEILDRLDSQVLEPIYLPNSTTHGDPVFPAFLGDFWPYYRPKR